MDARPLDLDRDQDAVRRIMDEAGWIPGRPGVVEAHNTWLRASQGLVAKLGGEPECLVAAFDGTLRHLDHTLPLWIVGAVATSRVARHQGLASCLSARSVADGVAGGAVLAGLGVFDHGFYDRLGFGTGGSVLKVSFDPARLRVPPPKRAPVRLGEEDLDRVHRARLGRRPAHGQVQVESSGHTLGEMRYAQNGAGLGFEDPETGELTHVLWLSAEQTENGPYQVQWMAFRDRHQLEELLGVLKAMSDQVHLVAAKEPPGVRFQDLLDRPFRTLVARRGSTFASKVEAWSYQQLRICDLPGCLERTHLPGPDRVAFRLSLTDPIGCYLPDDAPWRGIGGDWDVELGPVCRAAPARDEHLPVLHASVATFTRLWLGVARPSDLALTCPDLQAPPALMDELDQVLHLPAPVHDWDF